MKRIDEMTGRDGKQLRCSALPYLIHQARIAKQGDHYEALLAEYEAKHGIRDLLHYPRDTRTQLDQILSDVERIQASLSLADRITGRSLSGLTHNKGAAIAYMLTGWLLWTDAHRREMKLWADDGSEPPMLGHGVLHCDPIAEGWAKIADGLNDLLNGDVGNLDAGTINSVILACERMNGWQSDPEQAIEAELPDVFKAVHGNEAASTEARD